MRSLLLCLLALTVFACSTSENKKEPNELLPLKPVLDLQPRWKTSVGAGSGKLYRIIAPVIDGEQIYGNDYKGLVFSLDKNSGEVLWRTKLKLPLASGVSVTNGQLFVGSLDGDVIALDSTTGAEQWRVNVVSEILSPPQSNGLVVVLQTNDGKLIGLDAKTGTQLWTFSAQLPILTIRGTATPLVLGPNVVAGFANGKLAALSAVDGNLYWERRIARPQGRSDIDRVVDIDGAPIIANKTIFATSYNGTLSAVSPRGEILWSKSSSSYNGPVVIDDRVYVTSAEGIIQAFDRDSGKELWENNALLGRKLSAPQELAGFLVTADYKGYIHIIDPEAGLILERFRIDKDGVRSPMVSDGTYLYVMGNDGKLASLALYLLKP